jgi:hypothetical protein
MKTTAATWPNLLTSILADDHKKVTRLHADDPTLARRTEDKGLLITPRSLAPAGLRIFDSGKSGVTHWFYRGDTALSRVGGMRRGASSRIGANTQGKTDG